MSHREGPLFAFIRSHWLAYIIGVAVAVLLGLGASYFLGVKWSTPADVRRERIAAEKQSHIEADDMADIINGGSSPAGSSSN